MTQAFSAPAELAARELAHRRTILGGVAGLILLSISPVFGHHLAAGAEVFLAGRDHLWRLCLIAAHELAAPVHLLLHISLFGGIAFAAYDRAHAWLGLRHVLMKVCAERPKAGDRYWEAARTAGLDPAAVRVVAGLPSPAFTTGLLRPRVYIDRSLRDLLSCDELVAVLAHESSHVARRDPLRLSLLRALSCTLFWLPAVRRLADDAADDAEIRADDHAARRDPLVLASAIIALGRWRPPVALGVSVGFQHTDLLERRVRRLAGEIVPPRTHLTRRSILGAVLVLLVSWTTGVLVTHPLPAHAQNASAHCEHHASGPFDHLFCLGLSLAEERPARCPHAPA